MSQLQHHDREIYELDERIGRLAQVCGADWSRPDVVISLIKGSVATLEKHQIGMVTD